MSDEKEMEIIDVFATELSFKFMMLYPNNFDREKELYVSNAAINLKNFVVKHKLTEDAYIPLMEEFFSIYKKNPNTPVFEIVRKINPAKFITTLHGV